MTRRSRPDVVPFKHRTETVLRRASMYDEPSRFDTLTETEVSSWRNAGVVTVAALRSAGNRAIRRHRENADHRSQMNVPLAAVAVEPWSSHIWRRDPGFSANLLECDGTGANIAASGHPDDRRALWNQLDDLRAAGAA